MYYLSGQFKKFLRHLKFRYFLYQTKKRIKKIANDPNYAKCTELFGIDALEYEQWKAAQYENALAGGPNPYAVNLNIDTIRKSIK